MYKDLYVSYGRRESLGFVRRLHRQLQFAGFDAWFDKVNILTAIKLRKISPLLLKEGSGVVKKIVLIQFVKYSPGPSLGKAGENPA